MVLHTFRCETCDYAIDTKDSRIPHICPKCKERMYWDFEKANICSAGDAQGFYSPDLGLYIKSPSHLKKVLKKRGMVCLTDSKECNDQHKEMLEVARNGAFDKDV